MKSLKGFTLLEVIIALSILASIMILLTSSWKGNLRRVKKSEAKTQAVYLLEKKMTEIQIMYKNDIKNLPTDLQKGNFKDKNLSAYTWEWESAEFKMPDIARLFIQKKGILNETTHKIITQMKKYLEDSIKEVKVTIIYKSSPKAQEYRFSIATILVNYDTPLNLGLGNLPLKVSGL